jgi:peptidoglycan L-alanyl-D-glutamate endopeptidase CwlK
MDSLKSGATGSDVAALQQRLADKGFSPGRIDGQFGPATQTALQAFQRSAGLEPDGVLGNETAVALGLAEPAPAPALALPGVTVEIVSDMFPGTRVEHIRDNLPPVLTALLGATLGDKPMVLMALATIRAETAQFVPISEGVSQFNTTPGGRPFDKYDNRLADLGNQGPPDGETFKGRGFIQLTGRANYLRHSQAIGLGNQLVQNPELANDPDIAARLLASFLRDKEAQIRAAMTAGDLATARRLVNGGSHGLDDFRAAFAAGQRLLPEDLGAQAASA